VVRFLLLSILILLIARAVLRVFDGVLDAMGGRSIRTRPGQDAMKLVRDPVCGTFVAPGGALSEQAAGQRHYFCSERCRDVFRAGHPSPRLT
jgi:YHS domain-containing protein